MNYLEIAVIAFIAVVVFNLILSIHWGVIDFDGDYNKHPIATSIIAFVVCFGLTYLVV